MKPDASWDATGDISDTPWASAGAWALLRQPLYVRGVCPARNTVTVAGAGALYTDTVDARELNWIACDALGERPVRLLAKLRYRQPARGATAWQTGPDTLRVRFDEPQRAPAPGQALVLYDGERRRRSFFHGLKQKTRGVPHWHAARFFVILVNNGGAERRPVREEQNRPRAKRAGRGKRLGVRREGSDARQRDGRQVLAYAMPLVASSLLQALYSMVDTVIAGHFAGSAAISAINNSGQILNILTKIAIGITTGGNIIIGQYYGAKEQGRLGEAFRARCSRFRCCLGRRRLWACTRAHIRFWACWAPRPWSSLWRICASVRWAWCSYSVTTRFPPCCAAWAIPARRCSSSAWLRW